MAKELAEILYKINGWQNKEHCDSCGDTESTADARTLRGNLICVPSLSRLRGIKIFHRRREAALVRARTRRTMKSLFLVSRNKFKFIAFLSQ